MKGSLLQKSITQLTKITCLLYITGILISRVKTRAFMVYFLIYFAWIATVNDMERLNFQQEVIYLKASLKIRYVIKTSVVSQILSSIKILKLRKLERLKICTFYHPNY